DVLRNHFGLIGIKFGHAARNRDPAHRRKISSLAASCSAVVTRHAPYSMIAHSVGTLPNPTDDAIVPPFINQITTVPSGSRHKISVLPPPSKSPVPATDHPSGTRPTPTLDRTVPPFINQITTVPSVC